MYLYIKFLIIVSIGYYFFSPSSLYSLEGPESPEFIKSKSQNIIVVSDTQSPLWVEKLYLGSNNNESARDTLFNHILDFRPNAVFHLGDLVSLGYSDDSWLVIDQFLQNLSKFQIPFYPTLGNHELMIFSDDGEENFNNRFPFYSKTGYLKQIGPVAFILLNSNFSDLTDEEIIKQQTWYRNQLEACHSDTVIKAIIVGCHHPPFTNSKLVNSNEDVQKYFVPDFLNSEKCKLFLSGHSHSFEHFIKSGKDFLVIGGGGGLQHPLYMGQESLHKDFFDGPLNQRIFHYLNCQIEKNGMRIEIRMLSPDFSTIDTMYTIEYNFFKKLIVETH